MRSVRVECASNGWIVTLNHGHLSEEVEVYEDLTNTMTAVLREIDNGECQPSVYDWRVELVDTKKHEYAETIVVTRHKALLELLKELGEVFGDLPVIEHATVEDVDGKHVIGVLPMYLAVHAASITEVELDIPKELRGVELSLEQLRKCYRSVSRYVVKECTL